MYTFMKTLDNKGLLKVRPEDTHYRALKYENYLCKNLGGKQEGGVCLKGVYYQELTVLTPTYIMITVQHLPCTLGTCYFVNLHEPPATAQIKHTVHLNFHTIHTMYILDLVG